MASDRWHRVTEIFHAALLRDAASRDAFLADACRDDAALRDEVQKLLAAHQAAGSFGDGVAFAAPSGVLQLQSGTMLGAYRIESLIGSGGMGEVYKAWDTRLNRTVAIKVVRQHLRDDPSFTQRFQREAPDGRWLAFVQWDEGTQWEVHLLDMTGERSSKPLIQTRFIEGSSAISPDGRWIAYRSDQTGRYEIYVRPFPDVGKDRSQVSANGGNAPVWSPDGRELFFQNGGTMMVAAVQPGASLAFEAPRVLFTGAYFGGGMPGTRHYDISPDGQRFIMLRELATVETSTRDELTIVLNWSDELRQLVPRPR